MEETEACGRLPDFRSVGMRRKNRSESGKGRRETKMNDLEMYRGCNKLKVLLPILL